MRLEMRDAVRAALGAWFIVSISACATKSDVDSLRGEIQRLRKSVADMSGPPPSASARLKLVREDEAKFQAKVDAEKPREDKMRSTDGQKVLEAAAAEADRIVRPDGGAPPPTSVIKSFNCYVTICKGMSSHASEAAYRAFLTTAFGSGPNRYKSWFSVTRVDNEGAGRVATFYTGVAKATTEAPSRPREKGQ